MCLVFCLVFLFLTSELPEEKEMENKERHNRAKLIKFGNGKLHPNEERSQRKKMRVKKHVRDKEGCLPLTMPTGPLVLLSKSESCQSSEEDMNKVEELTLWEGPH